MADDLVPLGVTPANAFLRLQQKDRREDRHAHAILLFESPVRGRILLGAGLYRGYGLCRPMRHGRESERENGGEVT
jgi:CRISPR-associated protein Csb2